MQDASQSVCQFWSVICTNLSGSVTGNVPTPQKKLGGFRFFCLACFFITTIVIAQTFLLSKYCLLILFQSRFLKTVKTKAIKFVTGNVPTRQKNLEGFQANRWTRNDLRAFVIAQTFCLLSKSFFVSPWDQFRSSVLGSGRNLFEWMEVTQPGITHWWREILDIYPWKAFDSWKWAR